MTASNSFVRFMNSTAYNMVLTSVHFKVINKMEQITVHI